MYKVIPLPEFSEWLSSIRDGVTQRRLVRRVEKAAKGNLGDVKRLREDVWEMREFFGAGWRMYYTPRGSTIILMLGGGDKSTQKADIEQAVRLAETLED